MKRLKLLTRFTPERLVLIGLLVVALLAHGINFTKYPYFENDEATYVAQAWTTLSEGRLAPYTYYYDHAPAGWILLAGWFLVTGGLTTFGANPLISGRVFILVLHMISVVMLYTVTKRITRQKMAAVFSVLLFVLSPLSLYYGRRVLLDNIMVFWVLLSLWFATHPSRRLRYALGSAVSFALSVLSKENAIFFGPVLLYIVWMYSSKQIKRWAVGLWLSTSAGIMLFYPLYALLKNELLPSENQVSLLSTLALQARRGSGGLPWLPGSDFYSNVQVWMDKDPWILIFGGLAVVLAIVLNQKYREIKAIALTVVAQLIFFTRGALVFDFYILGVIPFLAMILGIMLARPAIWAKNHISQGGYTFTMALLIVLVFLTSRTPAFVKDETSNQVAAIEWVQDNLPKDAKIVTNNFAFPQLKYVAGFENVDFSFKVQFDPQVREVRYGGNAKQIDYLLVSHEEMVHMRQGSIPILTQAFENSQLVADFRTQTSSYIDTRIKLSTNGDWAQVYKNNRDTQDLGQLAWTDYKTQFMKDSGQVIDLSTWTSTSEGQSYAMLRALAHDDRVAFGLAWQWTQEELQIRDDALFAWQYRMNEDGTGQVHDTNTASDADQDIAYALIKAFERWGEKTYLDSALQVLEAIWQHEVVSENGRYYLVSGADNPTTRKLLVNPSYLSPHYYRVFADYDDQHEWLALMHDSYALLDGIESLSPVGIYPNWIYVQPDSSLVSASSLITSGADLYGFDAFRVVWRMYADKEDLRAQRNLVTLANFYKTAWERDGYIAATYFPNGTADADYSSISTSSGAVMALAEYYPEIAKAVYENEIKAYQDDESYLWGNRRDYYGQNWVGFLLEVLRDSQPSNALVSYVNSQQ